MLRGRGRSWAWACVSFVITETEPRVDKITETTRDSWSPVGKVFEGTRPVDEQSHEPWLGERLKKVLRSPATHSGRSVARTLACARGDVAPGSGSEDR